MKKTIVALRILTALVLVGLLISCLVLRHDNSNLRKWLSKQQVGTLSPDVLRLLVSDLESSEPRRTKPWAEFFQHMLEVRSQPPLEKLNFENLLAVYRSREAPARSNYFGDLVQSLSARQQTADLAKSDVIAYLGKPDSRDRFCFTIS